MASSVADCINQHSSGHDASVPSISSASPPNAEEAEAPKQSFSFVTITNPKQAKNKSNRRAVRSHAMCDYAASKRRRHKKRTDAGIAEEVSGSGQPPEQAARYASHVSVAESSSEDMTTGNVVESLTSSVETTTESLGSRGEASGGYAVSRAKSTKRSISKHDRTPLIRSRHESSTRQKQSVLVRDDETVEKLWKAGFVKPCPIRGLGDADPFLVLPQFRNPLIYTSELKMWCTRRFGTSAMAVHWVPALASSRLTYLAALCLGAMDMDVAGGRSAESPLTIAVKTEVMELVNEQLTKPEEQHTDETLMAVQLLLCGEIATGKEWIWRIHENAVTRILLHRGGLRTLGISGDLAVVVFSVILLMNILRESQPHNIYRRHVPVRMPSTRPQRAVPESPVYCPRAGYKTMLRSSCCREPVHELLCDMRDLTVDFIDATAGPQFDDMQTGGAESYDSNPSDNVLAETVLRKVRALAQFDPMLDAPSYSAWTFEACRIASLIFATALAARVPFSEAARLIDEDGGLPVGGRGALPRCLSQLRDAIANSNIDESWGEMIGVLFWVLLIGGAAARQTATAREEWTERDVLTQSYFASTAMRVVVLLCFEHGQATMVTLRRLNEVQRKLRPSSSRESASVEIVTPRESSWA